MTDFVLIVLWSTEFLFICLFDLWLYVPVDNYGHVETVSWHKHTFPGQTSQVVNQN